MKKIISILIMVIVLIGLSGCQQKIITKRDEIIYTTAYPIEFLTEALYGENIEVSSIYPDESNLNKYKFTNKQLNDFSRGYIFIYNGLSDEKDIARKLINKDNNLKIIDVSYGLSLENSTEELWLSPSNFLMLTSTVKNNLEEILNSKYATETIDEKYEELQTKISQMDAELRIVANNVANPVIVVDSNIFKFLEKYGYKVISLEDEDNLTPNSLAAIQNSFSSGIYKYILTRNDKEQSDIVKNLVANYNAKNVDMNIMSTIKEDQRKNGETYYTLLQENIDNIRNLVIGN